MADFFDTLWFFIRGDMPTEQFENWVYSTPELENRLGSGLYMDAISVDYTDNGQTYVLKERLQKFATENKKYNCECIKLADLDDVGMGEHNETFESLKQVKSYGDPFWWLSLYLCNQCQTNWMVAQEERINDVFLLRRLSPEAAQEICTRNKWPEEFKTFAALLRIGRERGHNCRFVDPVSNALVSTVIDLSKENSNINVSDISFLLEIPLDWAEYLCLHVQKKYKIRIRKT